VIIGDTEAERAPQRAAVKQQIAFYASTRTYEPVLAAHGWQELVPLLHRKSVEGDWKGMADLISDEMLETYAVTGTHDTIAARLQERYAGLLDRTAFYQPSQPQALDDPRLQTFARPIDLPARVGTGVLFNAMILHGTSNPGPQRRVSCDLRFFPLCGFLPSEVHVLDARGAGALRERQHRVNGPTLRTPLLESLVFLGERVEMDDPPPHSTLNWARYLAHVMDGAPQLGLPYLHRFINTTLLDDPPSVFVEKFHGRPVHEDNLKALRDLVGA